MSNSIFYVQKKNESFYSKTVKIYLSVFRFYYKDRLARDLESKNNKDFPVNPSFKFNSKFSVQEKNINGRKVWSISQKNKSNNKIVFYLHGGAYFYNLSNLHWDMLYQIASNSDATFVVPNYPLAPHSTYNQTYSFVNKVYEELVENSNAKQVVFLGDSAGGGLALGFAQMLSKQKERRQPDQTLLLAPWLDLEMDNPDINSIEKYDKILDKEVLKQVGKIYAKGTDTKNPLVSPIYGDFTGIKNISIFIGGHDLFLADAKKLKQKLEDQNLGFNYFEYPKMLHVWMMIPLLREGKKALLQIADLINRN